MMPIIRVEIEEADGKVQRAVGAEADAVWKGMMSAIEISALHGFPYRGPKMQDVSGPAGRPVRTEESEGVYCWRCARRISADEKHFNEPDGRSVCGRCVPFLPEDSRADST
jgi:hypothetical protein